jgi:hypothetical protein
MRLQIDTFISEFTIQNVTEIYMYVTEFYTPRFRNYVQKTVYFTEFILTEFIIDFI